MNNVVRTVLLLAVGVAIGFVGRGYMQADSPNGTSSTSQPRFDFIVGGPDLFWNQVIAGAEAAAEEFDINLKVHVPSGKPVDQTEVLGRVEAKGSSGVAISPIAPIDQTLLLSRLATKTHLITFDNDAPQSLRHCYVGTNNYTAGKMCGNVVREALPDGGNVIVFIGDVERQNATDRLRGFHDAIVQGELMDDASDYPLERPYSGSNITVVETYLDGQDPKQAEANVRQALEDHPKVDCMVGLYGYNIPACLTVLKELEKLEDVTLVAFDEHEATLDGVANGQIFATVVQGTYEYGFESVRLMRTLHDRNEHSVPLGGTGYVYLPCKVVSKDNIEEHRSNLAARLAKK